MANTPIQIKRSLTTDTPPSLNIGEPAYSYNSNTLFIGSRTSDGAIPIGGWDSYIRGISSYESLNAAYSHANSAFIRANNALNANVGGFISGDVTIAGNLSIIGGQLAANVPIVLIGDNIISLNTAVSPSGEPVLNAGIEIDRGAQPNVYLLWNETDNKWTFTNDGTNYDDLGGSSASSYANSAFIKANASFGHANAAYISQNATGQYANAAFIHANSAFIKTNASFDHANAAFANANGAFAKANAASANANGAFAAANAAYIHANSGFIHSNSAFDHANAAYVSQNASGQYANAAFIHANSGFIQTNSSFNHANSAFIKANAAYESQNASGQYANSAFIEANSAFIHANAAYQSQNATGNVANSAFFKANSAYESQNATGQYANAAFTLANGAFIHANSGFIQANAAYQSQNATGNVANAAFANANGAFAAANAAFANANGAFAKANAAFANANGAFAAANASYNTGNAAFIRANNSLDANNGGNVTGDVIIVGNLSSNTLTITGSNGSITGANAIFTNYIFAANGNVDLYIYSSLAYAQSNAALAAANASFSNANGGFAKANAAFANANGAFAAANAAYTHANAGFIHANAGFIHANSAFIQTNAAFDHANSGFIQANASFLHANYAFSNANAGLAMANAAFANANGAFAAANAAYIHANSGFIHANASFDHANAAYQSQNATGQYANSAFVHANSAYESQNATGQYANAAFIRANNSLDANNGGIVTANVIIAANLTTQNVFVRSYIDLNTAPSAPPRNEGRVFYDNDQKALSYNNESDNTVQLGQETVIRVWNNSGTTIPRGKVARIGGDASANGFPAVALAAADVAQNAEVVGVTSTSIANNDYGYVTIHGKIRGLNTSLFTAGQELFLSDTPGEYQTTPPASPSVPMAIGYITLSDVTDGSILVYSHLMEGKNKTDGAILFGRNGAIDQDPTKLYWDYVNNRLGIDTDNPQANLHVAGDGLFSGNVTITGNLVISNAQTITTDQLFVGGNNVILSANVTGTPTLNAAIIVNRGDSPNAYILWDETVNEWIAYEGTGEPGHILLANKTANSWAVYDTFEAYEKEFYPIGANLANSVNEHAKAGFETANIAEQLAIAGFKHANSGFIQANSSYAHANAAYLSQNATGQYANAAFVHANSAYESQNATGQYANAAFANANAGLAMANAAFANANGAFAAANASYNTGNAAFIHANSAFSYANTLAGGSAIDNVARDTANSAGIYANGAQVLANTADSKAVTAGSYANSAFIVANSGFIQANAGFDHANAAFAAANNVFPQVQPAFHTANAAFLQANAAIIHAQSAFDKANNADANALSAGAYANASFAHANAAFANANGAFAAANASYNTGNAAFIHANSAFIHVNAAYSDLNTVAIYANTPSYTANSGSVYANSAFAQANLANNNANAASVYANSGFIVANSGFIQANSAFFHANDAFNKANSGYDQANSAAIYANGAFTAANVADAKAVTAGVYANSAFANANGAFASANAAFANANGAFASANAAYDTGNAAFIHANSAFEAVNTNLYAAETKLIVNAPGLYYTFDQYSGNNPTIYVGPGRTIAFDLSGVSAHPFVIRDVAGGTNVSSGLIHVSPTGVISLDSAAQGKNSGNLYWKVPEDLRNQVYVYQCTIHGGMVGNIQIEPHVNDVYVQANGAFVQANAAFNHANSGFIHANSGFIQANASFDHANAAFNSANNVAPQVQPAFNAANAAFIRANNSLDANNGGTVTGNVIITQNVTGGNVIVSTGGQLVFPDGTSQNTAASGTGTDSYARNHANSAYIHANAAFDKANTGGGGGANAEVQSFQTTADGTSSTYALGYTPSAANSSVFVSIGGIVQTDNVDYIVTTSNSTISFNEPPPLGEIIRVVGFTNINPYFLDVANSAGAVIEAFNGVGDGVTQAFALGFNPVNANNVTVAIGGVIQPDSAYTVSNVSNTITFGTAPGNNENIRVTGFSKVNPYYRELIPNNVTVRFFETTSNGTTDTFNPGFDPVAPEFILVAIDGIVQPYSSYTVNSSQQSVTLDAVPENGEFIKITSFYSSVNLQTSQVVYSNVSVSVFETTANGLVDTYALGFDPQAKETLMVTIDGVVQPLATYSVNRTSNTITFVEAPVAGENVRVATFYTAVNTLQVQLTATNTTVSTFETTANGLVNTFNMGFMPVSNQALTVAIDGVLQAPSTYTINSQANTITFLTTPGNNEYISVVTIGATNVYVVNDGTITFNKLETSVSAKINSAFDTANTANTAAQAAATTGKAIAMSIVFGG